jgi:hypothetical protein
LKNAVMKPMPKIALKYVEEASERTLELTEGEITPLGFDDLANIFDKLDQPISFPLRLTGVRVGRNELEGLDGETVESISASLDSTLGSTTIGLVKGGWLPSGFAIADSLILPDRCTVAAIRSRFLGGLRKNGLHDDFLDFLADHPVKINPMLCAMEGISGSKPPSETELSAIFDRTANGILEALPHAVIFPAKPAVMKGALGLIQDTAESFHRKQKFLLKAGPSLSAPVGKAKRLKLLDQMFELALACGISKASMLMLTVLSAASAGQSMNPARKLLKPRNPYTKKDAYNALSDLRALDLLIAACADFPNLQVSLMTNDKALALLWSGLQAHSFQRNGAHIQYSINPHRALFNGLSDEELKHMWDSITRESA